MAVFVASFGYAGTLGLRQRLVDRTPERLRGQALGLDSSEADDVPGGRRNVVGVIAEVTGASAAMAWRRC